VDLFAGETDFALVGDFVSGEAFDQGGFPGAVVADEREHFARVEVKADPVQADDPAKGFHEIPGPRGSGSGPVVPRVCGDWQLAPPS
jgi:hypothetical protein